MKTKRTIAVAVLAVLLLLAVFYFFGPSAVPAGQEPLLELSSSNFGEFVKAFDSAADNPRLVLLLSPT